MPIELHLPPPQHIHCYDFRGKDARDVTAIIVALALEESEERGHHKTIISYACNYGVACSNPNCRYSKTPRDETLG